MTGYDVRFTADAAEFLARAADYLAADPVRATVVTAVAHRYADSEPPEVPDFWFAAVTDSAGAVVGSAMRTADYAPYPLYLLSMPDAAVSALARAVVDRGTSVGALSGMLPAADVCASEICAATGQSSRITLRMRLFELGALIEPAPVPGALRFPRSDEGPLAVEWLSRFLDDADVQAGRQIDPDRDENITAADVQRRIDAGRLWFWVDAADHPVHISGATPPAFGVSRIGPVYTPVAQRGRGWASAAVAQIAKEEVGHGNRVTLFTDQANPTSNRIYQALGFEPITDTATLVLERGAGRARLTSPPTR